MPTVLLRFYTLFRQAAGTPKLKLELPVGCTIHEVMELASKERARQDFRRLLWDESGNVLPFIMIIGDRVESSTSGVVDETVERDLNIIIIDPVGGWGHYEEGRALTEVITFDIRHLHVQG